MQSRLTELHLQRGRLLERIAHQRRELAVEAEPVEHAMHVGDRIAAYFDRARMFVLEHPVAVAATVGAVVLLRPGGGLRWARRGLIAWRTWAVVRPLLPGFLARHLHVRIGRLW